MIFLVICCMTFSGSIIVRMSDTFVFIEARFNNESTSDANGAKARVNGIKSCLNVFSNRPDFIPFGIGPGQTFGKIAEYKQYGYVSDFIIHNTFFALLYEFGLFSFVLFISLFYKAYKHLKRRNIYI